jgi:methylated-DNA-[protein]-cysteine S-methyltransferase
VTDLDRALRGFADRAAAEGLVDVTYAEVDSPLGTLLAAATPAGLVRLAYEGHEHRDAVLGELASRVSPRVLESAPRLDAVRRELDEYFEGRRRDFDLPVDLRLAGGAFGRRVLDQTARIPFGDVLTYAQVAGRAGSPHASRAAGNALRTNPVPIVVPCHRVVGSNGRLVGYAGGLDRKRALLAVEGR